MNELETSRHLFQRPLYRNESGTWNYDFSQTMQGCGENVHLDIAAVASVLSFGMVGEDRTLLKEIIRHPWMSRLLDDGDIVREPLPPHGNKTGTSEEIAKIFYNLLCDEARTVCDGFSEIYILLSGGLDSRIVAGVFADLYHAGDISAKPVAVTWGLPDSRDVVYAKQIASILGFDWEHIEFGPETVLENIDATASFLGSLHSPELLHNMLWFKNIPKTSLVIAGSFGDSIGRAEFAGLHLLQLERKIPSNVYQLIKPRAFQAACTGLNRDLEAIYTRAQGNVPSYACNEHWMQGYRMRGGLCHALSIINRYANIYQMFTAPAVYEFIWSLHPARRDDDIYGALLKQQFPKLARVPWPRTNKALRGATHGAQDNLRDHYHEYTKWSSGSLYKELSSRIDPDWFEATGIFEPQSIRKMNQLVKISHERVGRLNDIWLWLAGFRAFSDYLKSNGKTLVINTDWSDNNPERGCDESRLKKLGIIIASKSQTLSSALKAVRSYKRRIELAHLKRNALRQIPPVKIKVSDV
ncbi:MAG: asparagine synthase-related protein [Desulfobulbaceae bacterium]|nr:asparagine synthase-related protein [Desulfobulbaceae bacterium]